MEQSFEDLIGGLHRVFSLHSVVLQKSSKLLQIRLIKRLQSEVKTDFKRHLNSFCKNQIIQNQIVSFWISGYENCNSVNGHDDSIKQ